MRVPLGSATTHSRQVQALVSRWLLRAALLGVILIDTGLAIDRAEAWAQAGQAAPGATARQAAQPSEAAQLKVFEEVWQTVRDRFYDRTLHGLDWKQVGERYRPLVAAAKNSEDRARLINRMLGELGASHTEYYTPDDQAYYELLGIFSGPLRTRLQQMYPDGEVSYVGIGAYSQQLAGRTFATGILAGLPADRAGLRVGDEIVDVDGKPYRSIESFSGKADQSVILRVRRRPDGPIEPLTVTLEMIRPNEAFLEAMERSAESSTGMDAESATSISGPMPDSPIRGCCCRNCSRARSRTPRHSSLICATVGAAQS